MTVAVIDPRLLTMTGLSGFFPTTGSIEEATASQSDSGEESQSWTTVAGLDEIKLALSPVTGTTLNGETRQSNMTRVTETYFALLQGAYPQIRPSMRLVVDDAAWNILAVELDSQASVTRLMVEQVAS